MSTPATVVTVRTTRYVGKVAVPLLLLETLGLVGLVTSWRIAATTTSARTVISGVIEALHRASRHVDTSLREKLTTLPANATGQLPSAGPQ